MNSEPHEFLRFSRALASQAAVARGAIGVGWAKARLGIHAWAKSRGAFAHAAGAFARPTRLILRTSSSLRWRPSERTYEISAVLSALQVQPAFRCKLRHLMTAQFFA